MKQSAIEWLVRELARHRIISMSLLTADPVASAILQAKQIEEERLKQERMEGYAEGVESLSAIPRKKIL